MKHQRRGNYSFLFGASMVIVMGFGALSVDIGLMTMSKLQAQAAADAAAHAALIVYLQQSSDVAGGMAATWVVQRANVGMGHARMDDPPEYGTWDFAALHPAFDDVAPGESANAVRVTVTRNGDNAVPTLLAGFLGMTRFDVKAVSVVAQEERALMLVQDMSGSMMRGGSAVDDSRVASMGFFQYLFEHRQVGDKFGLAMFAQKGVKRIGPPYGTLNPGDAPWLPLMKVSENRATIEMAIDGICNTGGSASCKTDPVTYAGTAPHPLGDSDIGDLTNIAIGIRMATNQLKDDSNNHFFKGMVLMSDGVPNVSGSGTRDAVEDAQDAADAAWLEDINIWTVMLHNGDFSPDFMRRMTRGAGFYQESSDSSDLVHMYEQIAQSLPTTFVD